MSERKRFTAERKALILGDVREKGVPVSEAAEKYGVYVNDIYNRKKKLFENASDSFASPRAKASKESVDAKRIEQPEKSLKLREQAIDYLLIETIKSKKDRWRCLNGACVDGDILDEVVGFVITLGELTGKPTRTTVGSRKVTVCSAGSAWRSSISPCLAATTVIF